MFDREALEQDVLHEISDLGDDQWHDALSIALEELDSDDLEEALSKCTDPDQVRKAFYNAAYLIRSEGQ